MTGGRRGFRGGEEEGAKRTVLPRFRDFVAGGGDGDGERFRRFREPDTGQAHCRLELRRHSEPL